MIYHVPYPLGLKNNAASSIRPVRMLEAFRTAGYRVTVISGYVAQRRESIKGVKRDIKLGKVFDFLYSESSTMPTPLTELDHKPRAPFMDYMFFYFCKRRGIKTGLFYRDIYWRFPNYGNELSIVKKTLALSFYYFELLMYKACLNVVYLPSMAMGKYVPFINKEKFKALPPATILSDIPPTPVQCSEKKITLFFCWRGGT